MRRPLHLLSVLECLVLASSLAMFACQKASSPPGMHEASSNMVVTVNPGGPATIRTAKADFEILPSGYVQAYLLKGGNRLTLDDPSGAGTESGNSVTASGKEIAGFTLDFDHVKVAAARGEIGEQGKRVEITGHSKAENGVAMLL